MPRSEWTRYEGLLLACRARYFGGGLTPSQAYNTPVFPWIPTGLLRILRRNSHAGAPEAGLSH